MRFSGFELDVRAGELRKDGVRIKLQEQPLRLLIVLLENAGQVVTRAELQARLWPELEFGDFDHAVNLAVSKVRVALGDSSEAPRFIETLPRRGYRFVVPVESGAASTTMTRPVGWVRRRKVAAVLLLLLVASAAFMLRRHTTPVGPQPARIMLCRTPLRELEW
jgi:DNA-binding winged helix-turn-helix (wHTH) protein